MVSRSAHISLRACFCLFFFVLSIALAAAPCLGLGTDQTVIDSLLSRGEELSASGIIQVDIKTTLLDLARERLEAGNWQDALGPVQSLLSLDPKHVEAHGIAGALSALTGQRDLAERDLVFLQENGDPDYYTEFIQAVLRAQMGDYDGAEEELNRADRKRPGDPVIRYYRGSLSLAQGRLDDAETHLRRVVSEKPLFVPALAGLGQVFLKKNKLDQAAQYYERALDVLPAVTPYRQQLIHIYRVSGREKEAEQAVKLLLYYTPGVRESYLSRGMELFSLGEYESAVKEMDRVIGIYRQVPQAFYIRAAARINLGKKDQAIQDLRAFIKQQWGMPEAHHYAGMCYLVLGNLDLAERHFQTVIALNPDMGRSFLPLTLIEQMRGHYDRALKGLRLARQGGEPPELVDFFTAHVCLAKGDEQAYLEAMRGAVALVPGLPVEEDVSVPERDRQAAFAGDRNLMVLYFVNGWYDRSLEKGEALIEANPHDRFAHYYQALSHVAQRKHESAARSFEALLKGDPHLLAGHMGLGRVSLNTGDGKTAVETFQRAAVIDPTYAPARLGLGDALLQIHRKDEAVKAYEEAARIEPKSVASHLKLARLLAEQPGRLAAAERSAETAASLAPENPYVLDVLGWVRVLQGRCNDGLPLLSRAAERLGTDPVVLYHLGFARYRSGEEKEAEQALKKALTLSREFPAAGRAEAILRGVSGRNAGP
ncbi:MAG: tetratricopeptide repeat protein [Deltaproteobacteria bacterium]|nr:tetratricopeptide repeat protein [Deltaproteobacteria bacterium]